MEEYSVAAQVWDPPHPHPAQAVLQCLHSAPSVCALQLLGSLLLSMLACAAGALTGALLAEQETMSAWRAGPRADMRTCGMWDTWKQGT